MVLGWVLRTQARSLSPLEAEQVVSECELLAVDSHLVYVKAFETVKCSACEGV